MAAGYTHHQFRLEVLSPVAADSPFDSDTLWGRVLCALMEGSQGEQTLGESWLADLGKRTGNPGFDWQPQVIVSEGFQCDKDKHPWLPVPLAIRRKWEDE